MNTYPVRVRARLDEPLIRGLWLIKWLLAIPHYIVLSFLWVAFFVVAVIAFFAILFTGRYPRPFFEFNLGVLRWTWRVAYYSYGALGTDRYPPFTLGPEPDYPATLEIDYPARLSRGLVLVKWWLLAIPHYLVVGMFTSGSIVFGRDDLPDSGGVLYTLDWGGLIGLLVCIAAVALLFTGRYPRGIFDMVIGMNRWALRVAAYASLMTDAYPPFRLDLDERETPDPTTLDVATPHAPVRHTVGSIVAITTGAVLAFGAVGIAVGGAGVAFAAQARGSDGFISASTERVTTPTHALTVEEIQVYGQGVRFLRDAVGSVRIQATGSDKPLFLGIARQHDVDTYLGSVSHDRITQLTFSPSGDDIGVSRRAGGSPEYPPDTQQFWAAHSAGTLTWNVQPGEWAVVIMNADGSPGVTADLQVAATIPWLDRLATGLFVAAVVLLICGAGLLLLGVKLTTVTPEPPTPQRIPASLP